MACPRLCPPTHIKTYIRVDAVYMRLTNSNFQVRHFDGAFIPAVVRQGSAIFHHFLAFSEGKSPFFSRRELRNGHEETGWFGRARSERSWNAFRASVFGTFLLPGQLRSCPRGGCASKNTTGVFQHPPWAAHSWYGRSGGGGRSYSRKKLREDSECSF